MLLHSLPWAEWAELLLPGTQRRWEGWVIQIDTQTPKHPNKEVTQGATETSSRHKQMHPHMGWDLGSCKSGIKCRRLARHLSFPLLTWGWSCCLFPRIVMKIKCNSVCATSPETRWWTLSKQGCFHSFYKQWSNTYHVPDTTFLVS